MTNQLNFTSLFPTLEQITFPPTTSNELSTLFILSLWCLFGFFALVSFVLAFRAKKRIDWLYKQLIPITTENFFEHREQLFERAEKHNDVIALQWKEFDETLVEVKSGKGIQLYNTLDAADFFNSHSLASSLTENRMIHAVPGFLTAIGVIGTFMGLQLGLAELNISADANIDEMKNGVAGVINGAKIAFTTSVWGVTLSLVFNFWEKFIEQRCRRKISALQRRIDVIFPRLSAETQLQRIANDSQQSRESLQSLAEKIGEKMQESLIQATQGIQLGLEASLNKIMAPAINKLVEDTSSGNQKAMEAMLTSFMEGFGQQGEQQRLAMDSASENINTTLTSLGSTMNAFVNKMDANQEASNQREKELILSISSHENRSQQMHKEQHDIFLEQTEAMKLGAAKMMEQILMQVDASNRSTRQILEQGQSLQASIESSILATNTASENMHSSAEELRKVTDNMSVFGQNMRDASNQLSSVINEALESTTALALQNQQSAKRMHELHNELIEEMKKTSEIVNQINGLMRQTDTTFSTLQSSQSAFLTEQKMTLNQLSSEMRENVQELADHVATLLDDYSARANTQTQEHLRIWSTSATQYAAQMNLAVQALSNVVDEIETKMAV